MRTHIIYTAGVAIAGILVGAGGGYMYAERKLEKKYAEIASREIANAKTYYAETIKKEDYDTVIEAAKEVLPPETLEALVNYNGRSLQEEAPEGVTVTSTTINVFDRHSDASILAPENRTPDKPYVITEEEYLAGEPDYEQVSLTYFAKDDTLADDRDQVVTDVDPMIGDDNLAHFGVGTKRKTMLYIRNDTLEQDFEINMSPGSFASEALGFNDRVPEQTLRRMRAGDDG